MPGRSPPEHWVDSQRGRREGRTLGPVPWLLTGSDRGYLCQRAWRHQKERAEGQQRSGSEECPRQPLQRSSGEMGTVRPWLRSHTPQRLPLSCHCLNHHRVTQHPSPVCWAACRSPATGHRSPPPLSGSLFLTSRLDQEPLLDPTVLPTSWHWAFCLRRPLPIRIWAQLERAQNMGLVVVTLQPSFCPGSGSAERLLH